MATITTDVAEIANLLKRERFWRDTAQWDLCRSAFHPDASKTHVDVAWYKGEIDNFLEQSKGKVHQGAVNVIHSSFDPVDIHVNGTRAISEAFCLVTSLLTLNGIDYELASHMRLATRLEKISDTQQWRMLSLESIYVRDRLVTAFPNESRAASLVMSEEVLAYPKAYRCLAFVMQHRGLKPRPGLPHEGDQASIRELLDRNRAYLAAS